MRTTVRTDPGHVRLPRADKFLTLSRADRIAWSRKLAPSLPQSLHFDRLGEGVDELPTFIDQNSGIPFKLVPGGTFRMGCSAAEEAAARKIENPPNITFDELRPVRTRRVKPFLISVPPVLIGEYLWVGGKSLGPHKGWPNHPIAVTRAEAVKLSARLGYRLPTEAEWEYACRATTRTLFPWGDALLSEQELEPWLNTNFAGNISRASNRFGLKGLFTGEWCSDEYRPSYSPNDRPQRGAYVIRGGGSCFWPWQNAGEWVWCMSSMRMPSTDLGEVRRCGFRLVCDLSEDTSRTWRGKQ